MATNASRLVVEVASRSIAQTVVGATTKAPASAVFQHGFEHMDERARERALRRKRELEFLEKHRGHDQMHLEMFIVMILAFVLGQALLVKWRLTYPRSYETVTLFGLWILPVVYCLRLYWWRFIAVWMVYSLGSGYIIFLATRTPLAGTTPRRIYKWFLLTYKLFYVCGAVGYIMIMVTFFAVPQAMGVGVETTMGGGMTILFYGLYFGVLGRDLSGLCTEYVASKIGYYTRQGLPKRQLDPHVCCICGQALASPSGEKTDEKTYKVSCEHVFHEFCIRGWCIVGKKQTCPYCKEKVDLRRLVDSPWERTYVQYGQLLDLLRYLVVWFPIIMALVNFVNYQLGLEWDFGCLLWNSQSEKHKKKKKKKKKFQKESSFAVDSLLTKWDKKMKY